MLQIADLIHEHNGVARKLFTERMEALMDNALIEAIQTQKDIVYADIYDSYSSYNSMLERKYRFDADRIRKVKEETIAPEMYQYVLRKIVERYSQEGYTLRCEVNNLSNNYIKFVGLKELVFDLQEN